ncbi:MAG TPA: hypothetical protein VMT30_00225 [Candidatus Saccharimonadia bacterium]|nr:hypothetical protein [Candidatus Saccharimonadia bacterium]
MNKPKIRLIVAAVAALVAELWVPAFSGVAQAAPPQFTQAFVRPDRHKALTATGVMVCATPSAASTSATETLVDVTFPTDGGATDFVVNSTASNWTVDTSDLPAGATAWPSIGTATTVSGHTVRFPSGDLTAATQYCFHTAARLTNGSATTSVSITGATLVTYDNAGTPLPVNQTNWAYTVTTDDSIVVSAVVPPNFTIALSAFTDAFTTNLDPTNIVSTAGVTATVTTNAVGGWIAWVKDQYAGLHSAAANYTIDSGLKNPYPTQLHVTGDAAFDLVASGGGVGREGYVMDVDLTTDATGGCGFTTPYGIDAAFNSASGNGGGVLSNTSYRPIASCGGAAPATSDGDVLTLYERAVIRGGTPAGSDYTDVITVVGAGNF